uniref:Uncharacterized protein n=1 Tax=Anguilla anguilla TaxID=7936 RepID=A0A0E9V4W1_ANGAN
MIKMLRFTKGYVFETLRRESAGELSNCKWPDRPSS